MKYIRTKDGIYKYADYLGIHKGKRYALMDDAQGNRLTMCQEPDELYKSADTIEELCDELVVENPERDIHEKCIDLQDVFDFVEEQEIPIGIKDFDEKRDLISGKHDWKVYGAIWTDKGLIYVAKMNEKGELELL